MTYRTHSDDYAKAIEDKRAAVDQAADAYSKGRGTLTALNKANRDLADAIIDQQECQGGNVKDRR